MTRTLTLSLVLLVAGPTALADEPKEARTVEIEVPASVRTEIFLERSKRKTAARADRLLGRDTYARDLRGRELRKPKRYVPRTLKAKVKENGKK